MAERPADERRQHQAAHLPVRGVILRVSAREAEDNLFSQLSKQISQEEKIRTFSEDLSDVERIGNKACSMIHILTTNYLSTPLGGQIISPYSSRDILIDRVVQAAEMLFNSVIQSIETLIESIELAKINPQEFERRLRGAIENWDAANIALRELMNRLLTCLHINSPANLRPPLANVKLGFDIVH